MTTDEKIRMLLDRARELDGEYNFQKIYQTVEHVRSDVAIEKLMENRSASDSSVLLQIVRETGKYQRREETSLAMVNLLPFVKWSRNKVCYTFQEDVELLLAEQASDFMTGNTPFSLLDRLPLQSFFVSTNHLFKNEDHLWGYSDKELDEVKKDLTRIGFFFCVDEVYVPNMRNNFGIYWVYSDKKHKDCVTVPSYWNLTNTRHETLEDALRHDVTRKMSIYETKSARRADCLRAALAFQYVLYLCAENAEIEMDTNSYYRETKAEFVKHKPREVRQMVAGRQTGILLREFKSKQLRYKSIENADSGRVQSPHMRKAHWHRYWVGKRDSEDRHMEIRWVAPTMIHKELQMLVKPAKVVV